MVFVSWNATLNSNSLMANLTTSLIHHSEKVSKLLGSKLTWQSCCLAILLILALLLRLNNIQAPGDITREYTSAIFARAFFYNSNPRIETWRKEIALASKNKQPVLEPPITEYLVSIIYRLVEKEEIWYARFITSSFWLLGGIFLYKLSLNLLTSNQALIVTAYYLLAPSGILTSRSFQPDALMMMMYLLSLYYILKYFDTPSTKRFIVAAFLSGLTLLVRPLVLFAILSVFTCLSVCHKRAWRVIFSKEYLLFFLLSLTLPVLYYGYSILVANYMQWNISSILLTQLFLRKEYWQEWFRLGIYVFGHTPLIAAILGFWLLKRGLSQVLVTGMGIGYILFGLFFTYHIHTHGYYHLQLLPLIGICIAPTIDLIVNALRGTGFRYWFLPALASFLLTLILGQIHVNDALNGRFFENPNTATAIGETVKHSDRSVLVAYQYGLPLQYYGEISGTFWPRKTAYWLLQQSEEPEPTVQERIDNLGFIPEYFIITNFQEYYTHHQDLNDYLNSNCSVFAETEKYLIYNSCQRQ